MQAPDHIPERSIPLDELVSLVAEPIVAIIPYFPYQLYLFRNTHASEVLLSGTGFTESNDTSPEVLSESLYISVR